jgi:hypothetical protein
MPVIQNDFGTTAAIGYPGMVANGEISNRISRTLEDADPIAFGVPAFQGLEDHSCSADDTVGDFLGITMADKQQIVLPGGTVDTYPQYQTVAIMERGSIYVTAGAAFSPRDPIAWDPATSAYVAPGVGMVDLTGWQADMSAADGDIMRIVNNRP